MCVYTLATNGFIDAYIGPHVVSLGLDVNAVGYLFACYTIAYTLVGIALGYLKNIPLKATIVTGILCNLLGLLLVGPIEVLPDSLITVGCGLAAMGAGCALSFSNRYSVQMIPYILTIVGDLDLPLDNNTVLSNVVASNG